VASVWSSAIGGNWKPGRGYTHCINMWNLESLLHQLEREKLQGTVDKLGILAHGDRPGQVLLEGKKRVMNSFNLHEFSAAITSLSRFLRPSGKMIFFSCLAGMGSEGDKLLAAISALLPGREIVGFNELGWVGPGTGGELGGAPSVAGAIKARGNLPDRSSAAAVGLPYLTEWSPSAKWARDGYIVRPPRKEVLTAQTLDPLGEQRCGSFWCKGHRKPGQWCRDYQRSPGWIRQRNLIERGLGPLGLETHYRALGRGPKGVFRSKGNRPSRGPLGVLTTKNR